MDSRSIGFAASIKASKEEEDVLHLVTPKDLIQFGFIPEFVGRFGMIASVEELAEDQLVKILVETKNSIVKQYQYIFDLDGIELEFEKSALKEIANKAKDLKTNARGLKNIVEKTLLPYQFDAINLVD